MIAKCGKVRDWHWSHRGTRTCDPWWESETGWHRAWKDQFPKDWQEIIHPSESGEKHIADVKTVKGVVLEFQHSFLRGDERESREIFYPKMVWVVDGRRRARDRAQFFASLGVAISREPLIISVRSNDSALLRDWGASRVPVYFDFGDLSGPDDKLRFEMPTLWRLNPCLPNGMAYISPVPKAVFLEVHLKGVPFEELCSGAIEHVAAHYLIQQARQSRPLMGFERDMARRKQWARRRSRF